jgi:uncharacterized protein YbjT (DUF2867 family)
MRQAVVAGGTGLVGGHLLDQLSSAGVPTMAYARREGPPRPGVAWRVLDLAGLDASSVPPGTEAAFCCLGTTIRKAGSQAEFRRVDHDLVLAFARACREAGVPQLHAVSAAGADVASRIFYSRVKGETERDLKQLGFPTLALYRPSLIGGDRAERRPAEAFAMGAARVLSPILPAAIRLVPAAAIARTLLETARRAPPGVTIVPSRDIVRSG